MEIENIQQKEELLAKTSENLEKMRIWKSGMENRKSEKKKLRIIIGDEIVEHYFFTYSGQKASSLARKLFFDILGLFNFRNKIYSGMNMEYFKQCVETNIELFLTQDSKDNDGFTYCEGQHYNINIILQKLLV